jgi:hypothetical protein
MDYTKINLQAGDIVQVNSTTYGWSLKEFRIMRVREIEGDDGSLRLEFTMSEYDDSIYSQNISNFLVAGSSGIRAMGSIDTPGTPIATNVSTNAIPAMQVTSTVPAGIVDRMQFWAGNVLATGNVANTNFNLVGTVASTDALAFTVGNVVTFTTNTLKDGTYAWKTRGVNGSGTGPYSLASANIAFASGNALANSSSNAAANSTAVINSCCAGPIFQAQLTQGYQYSVNAGKLTTIIGPSPDDNTSILLGSSTFTVPASLGNTMGYKIDVVCDQNSSGASGGRGNAAPNFWGEPLDVVAVDMQLYNITGNANVLITSEESGGDGTWYWQDYILVGFTNLVPTNTYKIKFGAINYTESQPTADANLSIGWNIYTNNNAGF